MNGAWSVLARALARGGCGTVVGVASDDPGLLDAAIVESGLRVVPVRDQRVAAAVAAGYAAVARRPASLALTTGPAFSNALAGIAEAASLCLPIVVVTTGVSAAESGRGAFQELPQRELATPLAKWYHRVDRIDDLAWAARRALHLATAGRGGVCVLEVADAVVRASADEVDPDAYDAPARPRPRWVPPRRELDTAAALLATARAPLILAGGGARAAGAGDALLTLAERLDAPIVATAAGRGVIDEEEERYCGLTGLYATPDVDGLLHETDMVLAVGTQLEETARLGWRLFEKTLVHIDCDPTSFERGAPAAAPLVGDATLTVELLAETLQPATSARQPWVERVADVRLRVLSDAADSFANSRVAAVVRATGEVYAANATFAFENGLHDMWAYHWPLLKIRSGRVVVPGEQTMMGFGVAAAVGAGLASPESPVVAFAGDGALQMSLSALPTAVEQGLRLVVIVFDNGGFGWPRLSRAGSDAAELTEFEARLPYEAIARALGGFAAAVGDGDDPRDVLAETRDRMEEGGGLALVVVPVADDDVPIGVRRVSLATPPGTPE